MIRRTVTLPELGLIAGTRVALAAGIALLLADRLDENRRRAVGWALVAVGALTTVPLAAGVLLRHETSATTGSRQPFAPRPSELMGSSA